MFNLYDICELKGLLPCDRVCRVDLLEYIDQQ